MARKSSVSIEELISKKETEINNLTEQLKNAKSELKSLQDEKKIADSQKLMDAIVASGKSIDEVLAMLGNWWVMFYSEFNIDVYDTVGLMPCRFFVVKIFFIFTY